MIKSSSEPALRAGSEGGISNFSRGGVSRIFNSRGVFGIPPPLAIPARDVYPTEPTNQL